MRERCKTMSKAFQVMLVSVAALAFGQSGTAQPGEAGANDAVEQPIDAALPREDAAQLEALIEELDEGELPPGLTPLASYVVADEITVRGLRPGDIRKRLWDIDIEIERTTLAFFRLLNEVIVDEQFHVQCVRPPRQRDAQGRLSSAIIIERRCYAGYQADAMTTGSNPTWLMEKERQYEEVVMTAIAAIPSLAVAAEDLTSMHEERQALTGGEQALSAEQYRRQLARDEFIAPFEALERRRQRRAERDEERAARRQSESP
jgi:hypothetical protein